MVSMVRMSENRHEHWIPRKRDIEQAKTACACPPDVLISKLPRDANLITGTGIRDGALVLSRSHLKYIRFPVHPLFHVVLSALDLHPMQLSPNSYLQLSAFLALGLQVGASVDCSDFFHFHDCILIREEVDYFHFASKPNCRTFVNKPTSHKNWKHRPLLITGNWAAPELNCLKIRSTFAASASNITTSPSPERIQWLNTCLAGSGLDIKKFSTPALLLEISQERSSIIYSLFQPIHLKLMPGLEGKELTTHIVESLANMEAAFSECPEHVAERKRMRERVEKRNRSGETDEEAVHSFEDPDRVEPTMVRDLPDMTYSLPSKPSKLKTKRSGSSALGVKKRLKTVSDQYGHSTGTCWAPISSPTYPPLKSIPLNKEKNAALVPNLSTDVVSGQSSNCWIPKFKKDDGTFVTEEEKLVGNPEACLAVWQGLFHPADASAFQKEAPQEIMKAMNSRFIEFGQMAMAIETMLTQTRQNEKLLTITNENKDKQLEELKLELKRERQRANELETERDVLKVDFIKVRSELTRTENEFKKVKDARELEFQRAKKKIVRDSAENENEPEDEDDRDLDENWNENEPEDNEDEPEDEDDRDLDEYWNQNEPQDNEHEPEDEDDRDLDEYWNEDEPDDEDDRDLDEYWNENEPEDEDDRDLDEYWRDLDLDECWNKNKPDVNVNEYWNFFFGQQ